MDIKIIRIRMCKHNKWISPNNHQRFLQKNGTKIYIYYAHFLFSKNESEKEAEKKKFIEKLVFNLKHFSFGYFSLLFLFIFWILVVVLLSYFYQVMAFILTGVFALLSKISLCRIGFKLMDKLPYLNQKLIQ